jgi:hypothetical protein
MSIPSLRYSAPFLNLVADMITNRLQDSAPIARCGFTLVAGVFTPNNGKATFHGDIDLTDNDSITSLGAVTQIYGDLILTDCPNLRDLGRLTHVFGMVDLAGCRNLNNLGSLIYVKGVLDLSGTNVVNIPNNIIVSRSFIGSNGYPIRMRNKQVSQIIPTP